MLVMASMLELPPPLEKILAMGVKNDRNSGSVEGWALAQDEHDPSDGGGGSGGSGGRQSLSGASAGGVGVV